MKVFCITILTLGCLSAFGQGSQPVVYGAEIEHSNGYTFVSFTVEADRVAVSGSTTLVLSPVITDDVNDVTLPPVILQGGKRANLAGLRSNLVSGLPKMPVEFNDKAVIAHKGKVIRYFQVIKSQPWMEGANLLVETIEMGCCSQAAINTDLLVEGTRVVPPLVREEPMPEGNSIANQIRIVRQSDITGGGS